MTSCYRRFVKDFSTISSPLSDLLRNHRKWTWTDKCETSFQRLKEKIVLSPTLTSPICFLDRSLMKQERNFTVITDHHSLVWLNSLKDPSGRLCSWAVKLQQHAFDTIHQKGKEHVVPDCWPRSVEIVEAVQRNDPITDPWYCKMVMRITEKPKKLS